VGKGDLTRLQAELCTNNLLQTRETVNKFPDGQVIPSLQDLFLEQCTSADFRMDSSVHIALCYEKI